MWSKACWLAAIAVFVCLHLVGGVPARKTLKGEQRKVLVKRSFKDYPSPFPFENRPQTIDEVITQASGGRNGGTSLASRAMPSGLISDGGDMMLTPQQYLQLRVGRLSRGTTTDFMRTWSKLEISYMFNEGDFNPREKEWIEAAMAEWENVTCVVFRPAADGDMPVVNIRNGGGCSSSVGMLYNYQGLSLSKPNCLMRGVIIHELGHTMGLTHEHQRPDRDDYIRVDFSKVIPGLKNQMTKYAASSVDTKGTEYSYDSIMHYGKDAFSRDGSQTIFTKNNVADDRIGQRDHLSFHDVKLANLLYECSAECKDKPVCPSGCFVDKHCKCFCEHDMPEPQEPCVDTHGLCEQTASEGGYCKTIFWSKRCRKSCGLCSVTSGECKNDHPDRMCEEWVSKKFCDKEGRLGDWMKVKCRRSCGVCRGEKPSTTPTPSVSELCKDDAKYCEDWKTLGECTRNPGYMNRHCKKTCGVC